MGLNGKVSSWQVSTRQSEFSMRVASYAVVICFFLYCSQTRAKVTTCIKCNSADNPDCAKNPGSTGSRCDSDANDMCVAMVGKIKSPQGEEAIVTSRMCSSLLGVTQDPEIVHIWAEFCNTNDCNTMDPRNGVSQTVVVPLLLASLLTFLLIL